MFFEDPRHPFPSDRFSQAKNVELYLSSIVNYLLLLILAMRSTQINEYEGSEVIKINQNTSESTVTSGKVLVTIKAAGVDPADWKIRDGGLQQLVLLQFLST